MSTDTTREQEDLEILRKPDTWPNAPFMPVKHKRDKEDGRTHGFPIIGVVAYQDGMYWVSRGSNLFGLANGEPLASPFEQTTPEEIIQDWWVD